MRAFGWFASFLLEGLKIWHKIKCCLCFLLFSYVARIVSSFKSPKFHRILIIEKKVMNIWILTDVCMHFYAFHGKFKVILTSRIIHHPFFFQKFSISLWQRCVTNIINPNEAVSHILKIGALRTDNWKLKFVCTQRMFHPLPIMIDVKCKIR